MGVGVYIDSCISTGKVYECFEKHYSRPVKVNRPGKLAGPVFTGAFEKRAPDSIRAHGCSRIKYIVSIILNSLMRMLPNVLYEPYNSHSACCVWYGLLLVP